MVRPKKRKFFRIEASNTPVAGFEIPSKIPISTPFSPRGLPHFSEPPQLVIDRKLGAALSDMEPFDAFWVLSERLKGVLEDIDPRAVEFAEFNVTRKDGANTEKYWLCDVVRVADALDDGSSVFSVKILGDGGKFYALRNSKLSFKPDLDGDIHIFRVQQNAADIFCDEEFKTACRNAKVKGISFIRV